MSVFSTSSLPPIPTGSIPSHPSPVSIDSGMDNHKDGTSSAISPILKLPSEIIQQILSYLTAQHLLSLYRTCRDFQAHTSEHKLWIDLLKLDFSIQGCPATPAPFSSFRSLYLAYHPYWFLPKHKIWFSDDAYTGKLILVTYNPNNGSIEGYRLAAERPPVVPEIWTYKPDVLIHHLDPHVYVSTDDPVLSFSVPIEDRQARAAWLPSDEISMRVGAPTQKIDASLLLSLDLPEPTASVPSVAVWPPRIIPSMPRTRSSSSSSAADRFSSRKHKPHALDEISRTTFRLRTWSHFTQGMLSLGVRIGEEISTWSTLFPQLYTPSETKPYQGIFVGDYAAHGCEFLLVLQSEAAPMSQQWNNREEDSERRTHPSRYLRAILAALSDDTSFDPENWDLPVPPIDRRQSETETSPHEITVTPNVPDPDGSIHRGAIEAIKLTGDVNIPRGEHTFIADDISPSGTIRIAAERPFRGARVVKSRGHVAGRGFQDDEFIPSQLFLINPNLLAQYWLPFGHISFYRRIDIDDLLSKRGQPRRRQT